LLSVSVKAQNVVMYDSTYFFTHDRNISTMDAINSKKVNWYGFTDESQKFEIDTLNKSIMVYDYNNNLIVKEKIMKHFQIGDEFVYQYNGVINGKRYFVGELVFTKSNDSQDMIVNKIMYVDESDKYYGYIGFIKKGVR